MTKHHVLAITLTPSMLLKVAALRQGSLSGKILDLSRLQESPAAKCPPNLPQSRKKINLHDKVQLLQPLLPPRGANGRHYSRHAISKLFKVPYHMLMPQSEDFMRVMADDKSVVRSDVRRSGISQKSLCEQAHLSLH